MAHVVHLDELDRIDVAGVHWRPIRRALGVSAFGINAYSADAGEHLIEEHDETAGGAGGHEEIYLVVRGRATFTIGGEQVDAPAGTLVFLDDPAERRGAVAAEDGTLAVAIGGRPGAAGPPSPWEYYFAASNAEGREAYEMAADGARALPGPPVAALQPRLLRRAGRHARRGDRAPGSGVRRRSADAGVGRDGLGPRPDPRRPRLAYVATRSTADRSAPAVSP